MDFKPKHNIGDVVFLITDNDQLSRIVTGILIRSNGNLIYYLASGISETMHYDFEIAQVKNYAL